MWARIKTWVKNLNPLKTLAILGTFLTIGWSLSRAAKSDKRVNKHIRRRDAELVKLGSEATARSTIHAQRANAAVALGRAHKKAAIDAVKDLQENEHDGETVDDFLRRFNAKQRLRK